MYFGVFLGELSFQCQITLHLSLYCVSDAANSTWSTEGVTTVSVDEDEQMRVYNIVCGSSHFTAFAVLVDVHTLPNREYTVYNQKAWPCFVFSC